MQTEGGTLIYFQRNTITHQLETYQTKRRAFGAMAAVSARTELTHDHLPAHRKFVWLLESIRNYAFDFSVNFSKKGEKGLMQLHKTVQEELKDGHSLRVCKDQGKQKLDTIPGLEKEIIDMKKMQEEMNHVMKLKNGISTQQLEPISSSDKVPPEQVKENNFRNPTKKIMIRSRL